MSWINGAGFIELNNKSGPFFQQRELEVSVPADRQMASG
jgi:hypothetical protein